MKNRIHIVVGLILLYSCANIVAPSGGEKDIVAPKITSINKLYSKDNKQLKEIFFFFDELIETNNWEKNFYVSPPTKNIIQKKINSFKLILSINDSLKENTTYNLSLSKCIKDINEGNIMDSLNYIFSTSKIMDSLVLKGTVKDSYTLNFLDNIWVMLFYKNRHDSIIFKEAPNYIAKTNKNGIFYFPNLKNKEYKIIAVSGEDYIYDNGDQIAFISKFITLEKDSSISLLAFDPITALDSTILDTLKLVTDTLKIDSLDVINNIYGSLKVNTSKNTACIFQLLQNGEVVSQFNFNNKPYNLMGITPGKYQLKYIEDIDQNKKWSTGSWTLKIQSEKVLNFPSEVTIRSNWDIELEWELE